MFGFLIYSRCHVPRSPSYFPDTLAAMPDDRILPTAQQVLYRQLSLSYGTFLQGCATNYPATTL